MVSPQRSACSATTAPILKAIANSGSEGDEKGKEKAAEVRPINLTQAKLGPRTADGVSPQTYSSPRRLRQVHFKELDDCFASMSLEGRSSQQRASKSVGSEQEAFGKSDKRLKLATSDLPPRCATSSSYPRSPGSSLGLETATPRTPLGRSFFSSKDPTSVGSLAYPGHATGAAPVVRSDSSGAGEHISPRTMDSSASSSGFSCSTSGTTSASASPNSRGGRTPNRRPSLQERRGRTGLSQLSLKRCRSENRGWTGKREEVLGAEPGTPRLTKCDTL